MIGGYQTALMGVIAGGKRSGDDFFSSVVLLLGLDGNSTDDSPIGASMTSFTVSYTATNALVDQSLLITGGSTSGISSPASTNYDLNSSDFTIEGWIRPSALPSSTAGYLLRIAGSGGDEYQIIVGKSGADGSYSATYPTAASITADIQSSASKFVLNAWTHLAFTRSGNTYRFFVDGELIGTATNSYRRSSGAKTVHVANNLPGANSFTTSALYDEIRITKGVARYTSAFTPPAAPFDRS